VSNKKKTRKIKKSRFPIIFSFFSAINIYIMAKEKKLFDTDSEDEKEYKVKFNPLL
jgi:hypothetical protein